MDSYSALPFYGHYTNEKLYFGGRLKHMWIWSGIKCPSNIFIPRWRHKSLITSPKRFCNFPYNFLFRYFGIITIWYLHSHLTCDKLCQSCIDSSSFPFKEFSHRKSLFYFSPNRLNLSGSTTRGCGFN